MYSILVPIANSADGTLQIPGGDKRLPWIYHTAPLLGMLAAVEIYQRVRPRPIVKCAKLDHPAHVRCIHCGYQPPGASKA